MKFIRPNTYCTWINNKKLSYYLSNSCKPNSIPRFKGKILYYVSICIISKGHPKKHIKKVVPLF